jgi:predicted molibdopterin-dependent oxidoreductase YjgC
VGETYVLKLKKSKVVAWDTQQKAGNRAAGLALQACPIRCLMDKRNVPPAIFSTKKLREKKKKMVALIKFDAQLKFKICREICSLGASENNSHKEIFYLFF